MPTHRIDELIWKAFTDPAFCERMLNGHRWEVLESLSLPEVERQAVLAVNAETLEAFAGALCRPQAIGH